MFNNAKWISSPDTKLESPLFRKSFFVNSEVKNAQIFVCGLGYGVFTINGTPVTEDVLTTPVSKFDKTVLYTSYDVTGLIRQGENVIGCMLGNGWYNDIADTWDFEKASWRDHVKLICKLTLSYVDGMSEEIVSDSSWRTADGPCRYNHIRCGECWDARMEQSGWDTMDFNDKDWKNAVVCRSPGGILKPAELPPIRVIQTLPAKEVFPGVYDFGQNISGWVRIKTKGAAGGKVKLFYSERMDENGNLNNEKITSYSDPKMPHTDCYILNQNEIQEWEPRFCYHGFRYVGVKTENVEVTELAGRVVHTDLQVIGDFSCSDEMLNKIHMATRWATLGNYHGIPTDCPHREQNGWTGDACLSAEQVLMNYDVTAAYRKWLRDFQDVQRPSGQLPGIVPTAGWGFNWGSGPAWDSALILIPYYMWKYNDDRSFIVEFWQNMACYIDYMQGMAENNLVEFGLGDWCPPEGAAICPVMLTDTAYYYADVLAMAEMARAIGKCGREYEALAKDIRAAFRQKFVKDGKVFPESQTAYACAIYQGLLDKPEIPCAAARLAELVKDKGFHIDSGILGTKYIFRALSDNGYGETLYRMVTNPTRPSYAYWINNGMTTLCEDWEMVNSLNHHMFSEVELWFYRSLAGIRINEGKLEISPCFLKDLKWVKARHREIEVFWDEEKIEITAPTESVLNIAGKKILLEAGFNRVKRK